MFPPTGGMDGTLEQAYQYLPVLAAWNWCWYWYAYTSFLHQMVPVITRECNPGTRAPEKPGKPADFQTRKPGFVCEQKPGFSGFDENSW